MSTKPSSQPKSDSRRALLTVSSLANGIDPRTGEVFPPDSPYQSAVVIRALFAAVRAMEAVSSEGGDTRARMPMNAGMPWTQKEDIELLTKYDEGLSVVDLAKAHDRTAVGIQARLERHGRLPPQFKG